MNPINVYSYTILLSVHSGSEDWTQGLSHARPELSHARPGLSHVRQGYHMLGRASYPGPHCSSAWDRTSLSSRLVMKAVNVQSWTTEIWDQLLQAWFPLPSFSSFLSSIHPCTHPSTHLPTDVPTYFWHRVYRLRAGTCCVDQKSLSFGKPSYLYFLSAQVTAGFHTCTRGILNSPQDKCDVSVQLQYLCSSHEETILGTEYKLNRHWQNHHFNYQT